MSGKDPSNSDVRPQEELFQSEGVESSATVDDLDAQEVAAAATDIRCTDQDEDPKY